MECLWHWSNDNPICRETYNNAIRIGKCFEFFSHDLRYPFPFLLLSPVGNVIIFQPHVESNAKLILMVIVAQESLVSNPD